MNDKTDEPPRVWALLGPHRGDNNQVLALAEALGFPFEEKLLRYNQLRKIQPSLLGSTFKSLTTDARPQLQGQPPDLTISTGLRSVPVVRELRRRSGGKMRAVHLGYPRISPKHFDLVVPTPEYPVPDAPNVVRIPFALSQLANLDVEAKDLAALADYPRPRRLFVLGGPTLYWELPEAKIIAALRELIGITEREGGSILAIGSPRTPLNLLDAVENALEQTTLPTFTAPSEGSPSYRAMIACADELHVTADSVAMVADAVNTRKPVGIIPVEKSLLGRFVMAFTDRISPGKRLRPRDLRFFWRSLQDHGFGGTVEAPRASEPPDFTEAIAERVRQLLKQPQKRARAARDSDR